MSIFEKIGSFQGTVVLWEYDHGASCSFWLVPMTGSELEKWWAEQETFNDNPPESVEHLKLLAEIFEEPYQPRETWTFEWPGELIPAEDEKDRALWLALLNTKKHYFCHFYSDEDSYLTRPDGNRLFHKGRAVEQK